jgi:hypothetical protein
MDDQDAWRLVTDLPLAKALSDEFPRYTGLSDDDFETIATSVNEGYSNPTLPLRNWQVRRGLVFAKDRGKVLLCLPLRGEQAEVEVFVSGHVCIKEVNDVLQGFREGLAQHMIAAAA